MKAYTYTLLLVSSLLLSACTPASGRPDASIVPEPTVVQDTSTDPNGTTSIIAPDVTLEPFPTDKKMTVKGTTDCLPKKNPGEMQTMECAYGIKTSDGKYYGLRIDNDTLFTIETGKDYTVEGYFKEEPTSQYNIVGVILVTDLK